MKKHFLIAVMAFVAALSGCASPNTVLQEARATNSILAYEQLVKQFPNSPEASIAKGLISQLQLEGALSRSDKVLLATLSKDQNGDRAVREKAKTALEKLNFDDLVAKRDISELEDYIRNNRRSTLVPQAKEAIDDINFNNAQQISSIEALNAYLLKYPRGRHASEVSILIEQLEFGACEKSDTTYEAWLAFLSRYPEGAHASIAKTRLNVLEAPRVEALMRNLDINAIDKWGGTRLHMAAVNGDLILAKAMLRKKANLNTPISETGITPLHIAALHDQGQTVQWLLENGANPNATDKLGSYPLDFAPKGGSASMLLKNVGASKNEIVWIPLTKSPPHGFEAYDRASKMVIQRDRSITSYYFSPHVGCPRLRPNVLFFSGSRYSNSDAYFGYYFDIYSNEWRRDVIKNEYLP